MFVIATHGNYVQEHIKMWTRNGSLQQENLMSLEVIEGSLSPLMNEKKNDKYLQKEPKKL